MSRRSRPAPSVEELTRALRDAGLRVTEPRLAVLEAVWRTDAPMSHAEASRRLSRRGLDRVTVWRNLVALAEAGVVSRTDRGDHTWRFARSGGQDPRPTVTCVACGRHERLPASAVSVDPAALEGFEGVVVRLSGRCASCA